MNYYTNHGILQTYPKHRQAAINYLSRFGITAKEVKSTGQLEHPKLSPEHAARLLGYLDGIAEGMRAGAVVVKVSGQTPKIKLTRIGEDIYGETRYRWGQYHITRKTWELPFKTTSWRLTRIDDSSQKVVEETDTLSEMRENLAAMLEEAAEVV